MNKTIKKIIFSMIILFMILLINTTIVKAGIGSVNQEGSIGTNHTLSFRDMCSTTSGLYCLESHQANSGSATYKVLVYIHIEDGVATMSDINGDNRTAEGEENKVLAQILSGEYGGGYGTAAYKYTDAQCALYVFFEEWATSTGLVNNSWYGNNNPDADTISRGHATVAKARAAVAAGANPSADIYLLDVFDGHDSSAWQRLLYAIPSIKDEEPEPAKGNGKVIIKGNTSVVGGAGKDSQSAKTIPGGNDTVKVWWKAEEGKRTLGYTEIKLGESYQFESGIDIQDHYYRPNKDQITMYNNSYVEFEYNGLKYTTNALTQDISLNGQYNTAKENIGYRNSVDGKYSFVSSNQSEIAQEQNNLVRASTKGIVTNLIEKVKTHAKEQGGAQNDWLKITQTWCMNGDENTPGDFSSCDEHKNESNFVSGDCSSDSTGPTKPRHGNHKYYMLEWEYTGEFNSDGTPKKSQVQKEYSHDPCADADKYNSVYAIGPDGEVWTPDVWIINGMNLQLIPREMVDLSIESDINNVKVVMNNQEYTYKYGNRGISTANVPTVAFTTNNQTYSRPINPSDVRAATLANDAEKLQIYVTYDINAYNESNTLQGKVQEIANYYDYTKYDLVTKDGWEEKSRQGDQYQNDRYKAIYYQTTDESLYPVLKNGQSWTSAGGKVLQVTFKVKFDVIKDFCNKGVEELFNVSEIGGFTPMYGDRTIYAEHQSGGRTGNTYASVDYDSNPLDAKPQSNNTWNAEDDTSFAPIFKILFDDNKIVTGTIWEDRKTGNNNERNGNGQRDDGENVVENVKIELIKINENGQNEISKLHRPKKNGDAYQWEDVDAVAYSKSDGTYELEGVSADNYILKYTYGNNTIITDSNGNKILENPTKINGHEINARNYKSTIVTEPTIQSVMKEGQTKLDWLAADKWHLKYKEGEQGYDIDYSTAIDDLEERKAITDLEYDNFYNPQNMTAYSAPFKIQVEYNTTDNKQEYQTTKSNNAADDTNGERNDLGNFTYIWKVFDFGIIERAREDIVIDKTIQNLKITLANGQILTEGNPYKTTISYVKAIGNKNIISKREEAAKAGENPRNVYIEIDSELIQGATLDLTYAITVTNNSEADYEYDYTYNYSNYITRDDRADYYYYGKNTAQNPLITPTVNVVADYMENELTCDLNEDTNKNWKQALAGENEDKTKHFLTYDTNKTISISKETYDRINKESANYLVFVTDSFKDVTATGGNKTEYLHVSKLLGNQATDYTYDNHTEILKLGGKIARTIDSVANDGTQNTKQYRPGDYVPNLGRTRNESVTLDDIANNKITLGGDSDITYHQQDDDMITVRITPPTGLTNHTTLYIIVGGITLTVLAVGVIIIKRKVLA